MSRLKYVLAAAGVVAGLLFLYLNAAPSNQTSNRIYEVKPSWWRDDKLCDFKSYYDPTCFSNVQPTPEATGQDTCRQRAPLVFKNVSVDMNERSNSFVYCCNPSDLNQCSRWGLIKDMCAQWGAGFQLQDAGNYSTPLDPQNRPRNVYCEKSYCPLGFNPYGGICYGDTGLGVVRLGQPQACGKTNPIDLATGNKFEKETDYSAVTKDGIHFERFYNSLVIEQSERPASMGMSWTHSYNSTLNLLDFAGVKDPATIGNVQQIAAYRPDGMVLRFNLEADGLWSSETDVKDTLKFKKNASGQSFGFTFYSQKDRRTEEYDAEGKLLSITSSQGRTQLLTYNAQGQLAEVSDSYGKKLTFEYHPRGQIKTIRFPGGDRADYKYVFVDRYRLYMGYNSATFTQTWMLTEVEKFTVAGVSMGKRIYHYEQPNESAGALTGITNEKGLRYITWAYQVGPGSLLRAISSQGLTNDSRFQVSYPDNLTTKVTNADGNTITYTFQLVNNLKMLRSASESTCVTCGSGNVSGLQFTYNTDGSVQTSTDEKGVVTKFEWDSRGREKTRILAFGTPKAVTIVTEYHPTFDKITKVAETQSDPAIAGSVSNLVKVTDFVLDPTTGDVLEERTTSGTDTTKITYTYWSPGLRKTETFGNQVMTFNYYPDGMLKDQTDNTGRKTTLVYDTAGRIQQVTSSDGMPKTFTYTASGRIKTTAEGSAVTTFSYDTLDRLSRVTNPDGLKINYIYVGNSEKILEIVVGENQGTPQIQNRTVFRYNARGNVDQRSIYDGAGTLVHRSTLNEDINARTLTVADSGGRSGVVQYDTWGRPISRVNAHGTSSFLYDEASNLTQWSHLPSGTTYKADYSSRSDLVRFTDAKGTVTNFTYNGIQQLTKIDGLDWGTQQFQYVPGTGFLKDDLNHATGLTYDLLNRPQTMNFRYADGALGTVNYSYLPDTKGFLSSVRVNKNGLTQVETKYGYDTLGRVIQEQTNILNPMNGGTRTQNVIYGYNAINEVQTITYPSGAKVEYIKGDGQIKEIKFYQANGTYIRSINNVKYDAFGRVKSWALSGTAVVHSRGYHGTKQLLSSLDYSPALYRRDFTYDVKDNINRSYAYISGQLNSDISMTYDDQGRVLQTDTGSRTYDMNGNVTKIVRNLTTDWTQVPAIPSPPLTVTPTVPAATQSGLLGLWKFDEATYSGVNGEVLDSSGNNRHGKMSGTMTTIPGIYGKSLDGAKFSLRYFAASSLPLSNEIFTAQMWVRTTDRTAWKSLMARNSVTSGVYNGWAVQFNSSTGKIYLRIDTSAGQNQTAACNASKSTDPVVADGRWHLVTVSMNNGSCSLFVDGVKYSSGTYNRGAGFTGSPEFRVYSHVIGQVDEAAYWGRAITDTEASGIYAVTAGSAYNNTYVNTGAGSVKTATYSTMANSNRLQVNPAQNVFDVVRDGLLGYWKFDEASYTTAAGQVRDSSGLNRHGQVNAAMNTGVGLSGKSFDSTVVPDKQMIVSGTQLPASLESVTAQVWVKTTSLIPWKGIVGRRGGAVANGWILSFGNGDGKVYVRVDTSAGQNQTACAATRLRDPVVADGQWHQVTVVIHNSTCKLYIDGVKYAESTYLKGDGFTVAAPLTVYNGVQTQLDEVALWARPLSDAEIRQNYRSVRTSTVLAYSADGHQISNPTGGAYKYDTLGNMEGFGQYSYVYNSSSQRVAKISNPSIAPSAQMTSYVYDFDGRLLGEYDKNGTPVYEIFYFGDTPVALMKAGILYMIVTDQVMAPRLVFRAAAPHDIVWKWDEEIFGDEAAQSILAAGGASFEFNLRFPGQVFDKESQLHYNMARYYEPTSGRYLQTDRTGLAGGPNPYAYADSKPMTMIDPYGEDAYSINFGGSLGVQTSNPIFGKIKIGLGGMAMSGLVWGKTDGMNNICLQTTKCNVVTNSLISRKINVLAKAFMQLQTTTRPLCSGVYNAKGIFADILSGRAAPKYKTTAKHDHLTEDDLDKLDPAEFKKVFDEYLGSAKTIRSPGQARSIEVSGIVDDGTGAATAAASFAVGGTVGYSMGIMPSCEIRLVCLNEPPCCERPEGCEVCAKTPGSSGGTKDKFPF